MGKKKTRRKDTTEEDHPDAIEYRILSYDREELVTKKYCGDLDRISKKAWRDVKGHQSTRPGIIIIEEVVSGAEYTCDFTNWKPRKKNHREHL